MLDAWVAVAKDPKAPVPDTVHNVWMGHKYTAPVSCSLELQVGPPLPPPHLHWMTDGAERASRPGSARVLLRNACVAMTDDARVLLRAAHIGPLSLRYIRYIPA